MKKIFSIIICLLMFLCASGQVSQVKQRSIRFTPIYKDSMAIHMDQKYFIIEDSCSSIIRHVRFDPPTKKFKGHFRDVSSQNPEMVLSKGFYTEEGKLNGPFEEYYPSGKLKAKGTFNQGEMDGAWTIWKEDGSKWLEYESVNGTKRILNAWDEKGKQIIKDGNGNYSHQLAELVWTGKLVDGSPDGTWRSTHILSNRQNILSQETFSKNKFLKGSVSGINYQDQSRLNIEPRNYLNALTPESFRFSEETCDGEHFTNNYQHAYYKNGNSQLLEILKNQIGPALGKFDYSVLNLRKFRIYGVINEKGIVTDLRYVEFLNFAHATELINAISNLPSFVPAKENGVNVKSTILFEFNTTDGGWYNYQYRFSKFQEFKSIK